MGIFFWVIKIRYITHFWLPETHVINNIGFELIGSIIILMGILIIHRVYPFVYSNFAIGLIIVILALNLMNIIDYFTFKFFLFSQIHQYTPFAMSLMLIIISKLMENSIRYFGNSELSKKWKNIGIIILYGFSIPFYTFISFLLLGFISFDRFQWEPKVVLLLLPLVIIILFLFIYYLHTLILTFQYLLTIQRKNSNKQ